LGDEKQGVAIADGMPLGPRHKRAFPMAFKVMVDDNFHYQDEDERYTYGEFDTLEAAVDACKKIVDEYLRSAYKPGMTAEELYASYQMFGEDPWVSGADGVPFCSWKYAEQRCADIAPKAKPMT